MWGLRKVNTVAKSFRLPNACCGLRSDEARRGSAMVSSSISSGAIIFSVNQPPPVFISYARKDYYFAESLAFRLHHHQVPVWLDAKDLAPGIDWQQQLESALDNASCVLVVVSSDSIRRPAVRMEWERAIQSGSRIIVVLFRRAQLPPELAGRELVDFRNAFKGPLRTLIQLLAGVSCSTRSNSTWIPLPPWILMLTITLLVPLVSYFALADWSTDGQGSPTNVFIWVMLPFFAFAFFWFLCFSFLRRRMGMTHLAASFGFSAMWSVYPLLRYWFAGTAHLPDVWRNAIAANPVPMELSAALTAFGFATILLIQPADLLRWTPTGKAWGWYRQRSLSITATPNHPSILHQVKGFALLHDEVDAPAASRLRQELGSFGAWETPTPAPQDTTVLLLTSRTHTQWLSRQNANLNSKILTIVGSRIGLPTDFEWLWKREWIDLRHWDLSRLDRRRGLLQVPEAVTNIRYPRVVRLVHHLLCAFVALTLCLFQLANPAFNSRPNGQEPPWQETVSLYLTAVICLLGGILAQRLLNRTVSELTFQKSWKILIPATSVFAIWAIYRAAARHLVWPHLVPIVVFLLAFPLLLMHWWLQLSFWFPTRGMGKPGSLPRLSAGRQWQTLLWTSGYTFAWSYILALYPN
jgi:hypothetical protein